VLCGHQAPNNAECSGTFFGESANSITVSITVCSQCVVELITAPQILTQHKFKRQREPCNEFGDVVSLCVCGMAYNDGIRRRCIREEQLLSEPKASSHEFAAAHRKGAFAVAKGAGNIAGLGYRGRDQS
jgi:hypothetical protein